VRAASSCWLNYAETGRAFALAGLHNALANASTNTVSYYRTIYVDHAGSVNERFVAVNMNFYG
jgi:hypothetical protein